MPTPQLRRSSGLLRLRFAILLYAILLAVPPAHAVLPALFETSFHDENDLSRFSVAAHVDHDGVIDLLTCTVDHKLLVRLGLGDGRFVTRDSVSLQYGRDLVVGDLNGDTHLDVVISKYGWAEVVRLLGNGDGTFGPPLVFPMREPPSAMALADLDLDGKLDLIVTKYNSDTLTVLRGLGDGNLTPTADYFVAKPVHVAVAKIGSDSYPDVVIGQLIPGPQNPTNPLSILPGGPQGILGTLQSYPASSAQGVAAADVNGDGRADVVSLGDDSLRVLLGQVNGTLLRYETHPRWSYWSRPVIVDVDDDGLLDIVLPGIPLHVHRGVGGGHFAPRLVSAGRDTWMSPGDFNGDGHLDLYGRAGLWPGNGDGTFGTKRFVEVDGSPNFTAVGDVDEDGSLDLVVSRWDANEITVLLATPTGFEPGASWNLPYPQLVALRDLDGDDHVDVIARSSQGIAIALGDGGGGFAAPVLYPVEFYPLDAASGDLNGDQVVDLLVAEGGDSLLVLLGDGDGAFGNPHRIWSPATSCCLIADVDGDGHEDAVAGTLQSQLWVALGRGDGFFDSSQLRGSFEGRVLDLVTGHLDSDEYPDLVVLAESPPDSPTFHALLGVGFGVFSQSWFAPTGVDASSMVLTDGDRNGTLDLAIACRGMDVAAFYPGNGDGTFQLGFGLGTWWGPSHIVAAEMSGDSRPDLVVTSASGRISILRNIGLGYAGVTPPPSGPRAGSAFPNPTRGAAQVRLTLVRPSPVEMVVRDLSGRTVRRMHEPVRSAGTHQLRWDGTDEAGRRVPSGLYFVELITSDRREMRRVTMLR